MLAQRFFGTNNDLSSETRCKMKPSEITLTIMLGLIVLWCVLTTFRKVPTALPTVKLQEPFPTPAQMPEQPGPTIDEPEFDLFKDETKTVQ